MGKLKLMRWGREVGGGGGGLETRWRWAKAKPLTSWDGIERRDIPFRQLLFTPEDELVRWDDMFRWSTLPPKDHNTRLFGGLSIFRP